jgi:hypothetical protein
VYNWNDEKQMPKQEKNLINPVISFFADFIAAPSSGPFAPPYIQNGDESVPICGN